MTAEDALQVHTDGFNRALQQQLARRPLFVLLVIFLLLLI
jgi:hypothetical protein